MAKYRNPLLDFVRQRPLRERASGKPKCPFCGGKEVAVGGHRQTLVGGGPGSDPNHHWYNCDCLDCQKSFVREVHDGNVWYTKDHAVLKGMPSCFESYIYSCKKCGGEVVRDYRQMDGKTEAKILCLDLDGPHYRTFYRCGKCGLEIETYYDRWWPGQKSEAEGRAAIEYRKKNPPKPPKWKIYEEIGEPIYNAYGVGKPKEST